MKAAAQILLLSAVLGVLAAATLFMILELLR
jgi:hypothetical protein